MDFFQGSGGVVVDVAAGTSTGGAGNDTFVNFEQFAGTNFADVMTGDANDNYFYGRGGDDILNGGDGDDGFEVGDGNDIVNGGAGNDSIHADLGNNIIDGGTGIDRLQLSNNVGGVVVDMDAGTSTGGSGNNTFTNIENITGSNFDDVIIGDAGDNRLRGGGGDDLLTGGGGADTFVFSGFGVDGVDTITDFQNGTDVIDLFFRPFGDVNQLSISQNGLNTEIEFPDGDVLILENFNSALLDNSDFLF